MNTSERDEIEILKDWLNKNGLSTVMSIVIAVGVFFGWQNWQQSQQANRDQGARDYEEFVSALSAVDQDPNEINLATADHLSRQVIENHAGSGYSVFASFFQVQQAVESGDLPTAENLLRELLDENREKDMADIIRLRLARVLSEQSKYEEALGLLAMPAVEAFKAAYLEAEGDLWFKQADYGKAADAYRQAIDAAAASQLNVSALAESKLAHAESFL